MEVDSRRSELVSALNQLRAMVADQTQLDIADYSLSIGKGRSLSKSTVSDLLRGKLNEKSGPNILLLCDAIVGLAPKKAHAEALKARALRLWEEITSPEPRWSTAGAPHFARQEWDWGAENVYPDTKGVRYAFAITCMNPTQRPVRPEVFTTTMRAAALTCIDWGPLRRHGGFQEYATLTDTGFRVWGSIGPGYGYPRRLVSISASVFGAVACYWFGEAELDDENPKWTVERAALCSLLAIHSLMGSSGEASISKIVGGRASTQRGTIPLVSSDEEVTGYGWPERVVDVWAGERSNDGDQEALDDLPLRPTIEGHPTEEHLRIFGGSKLSTSPLQIYGRRLR